MATSICEDCGILICDLCKTTFEGRTLCLSCFSKAHKTALPMEKQTLGAEATRYDRIALALSTLPILFTWPSIFCAPTALYIVIRRWKEFPYGLLPQSRIRLVCAALFATLTLLGWAGLGVLIHIVLLWLLLLSTDVYYALCIIASFLLYLGYFMLLEWAWRGQTVGKRIVGIRVMDAQAGRLTGAQVVIRTLFRTIDMFPYFYFVGGLVSVCRRHFQRLGDHVAGTVVIRTQRVNPPSLQDLPPHQIQDPPFPSPDRSPSAPRGVPQRGGNPPARPVAAG